jgi:hypothetical protein
MHTFNFWQLVAAVVLLFAVVLPLVVALGMIWRGARRARAVMPSTNDALTSSARIARDRL